MRLFIAIIFSEEIKTTLFHTITSLKKQAVSGNFTQRDNLHLTLAFLGEFPLEKQKEIRQVMNGCLGKSFPLEMSGLGKFKGREGELLYWMGVKKSQELLRLQDRLVKGLKKEAIYVDEKPFEPHITIARRCKTRPDFSEDEFTQKIMPCTMHVDRISLMKSERIGGKLIYSEVYHAPLK